MEHPLAGRLVGVTAARKVAEQTALLERRGAEVVWGPALSTDPYRVDEASLRAITDEVLTRPVDLVVGTTGVGMRTWFDHAETWGVLPELLERLGAADIIARGSKTVGALRQRGLRESFVPDSEELADLLAHARRGAREGDLSGRRVVVQEHGQSLADVAELLRTDGADVVTVTVYRVQGVDDDTAVRRLAGQVADREVDAVTFTSPPAVAGFMAAAGERVEEVTAAFASDVVACSVGHVTAAAWGPWDVPTIYPDRGRLGSMIGCLTDELVARGAAAAGAGR